MRVTVYGDKLDLADELIEEFRKEAKSVVREGVDMYVEQIRDNASRYTSGRSTPGRFPVRRSGDLERSFRRGSVRLGRDKASVSGEVISRLTYEEVNSVEYGHVPAGSGTKRQKGNRKAFKPNARVLPRPFIRPADMTVEPKIEALFEARL